MLGGRSGIRRMGPVGGASTGLLKQQLASSGVLAGGGSGGAVQSLNDLLTSATNAAKVAAHVARVEREAQALCKRIEDTLLAMAGGDLTLQTATTAAGADEEQEHAASSAAAADVPAAATSPAATTAAVPDDGNGSDPLTIDPAASPLQASPDTTVPSASPRSPASASLLAVPMPPAATLAAQCAPAARRRALDARRAHVAALRAKLDAEQVSLQAQRAGMMARRQALLPKLSMLQSAQTTQLAHREALEKQARKQVADLRLQLHLVQLRQSFRRRTLLHSLSQIYPLTPPRTALKSPASQHPLMCYTIRGLRLPNNFNNILTSFEEEQVSTALGYVCHLILLLSKYLDVRLAQRPLRAAMLLQTLLTWVAGVASLPSCSFACLYVCIRFPSATA
jgi:hypothetical protein